RRFPSREGARRGNDGGLRLAPALVPDARAWHESVVVRGLERLMETAERPGLSPGVGLAAAVAVTHFEVIPLKDTMERVAVLPAGSIVTITASPVRGIEPTIDLAVKVAAAGYVAVPHLAARSISDRKHLLDIVERLEEAGV